MGEAPERDSRSPAPVRRAYAPVAGNASSQDAFERVTRFRLLAWSLVGAFLGLLLGVFVTSSGSGGWLVVLFTTMLGWALVYFGPLALASASGRAAGTLYAPSGRSTPRKKEYSLAESYVARGDYEAAIEAFEAAIAQDPAEPMPYLRIARIRRDRMGDPEGAAEGFRRVLTRATLDHGVRLLALREMVELCETRLGDPRRAAPLLARVAEQHEGSPEGLWAVEELTRIRRRIAEEAETD